MKKFYILLVAIFTINVANAQQYIPFPESNAVWNQKFQYGEFPYDTSYYFQYGFNGDTLINSLLYHKVYRLNDTTLNSNATYQGCLREDTLKKVFYIGKGFWPFEVYNQEIQLYDFSKTVGDTINYGIYGKKQIISVDSILINNNYRKRFHVLWDYFIEGIGSVESLLSPITAIPNKVYTSWNLVCFKQNDNIIYLNPIYNSCFPSLSNINEITNNNNISIYPNPTKDNLTIETNTNTEQRLEIINLIGQTVYTIYINKKATVNTSAFAKGVYILKLSSDKETLVRKIVKE